MVYGCGCPGYETSEDENSDDKTAEEDTSVLDMPGTEKIYLLTGGELTDKDIEYIANYETRNKSSQKVDKLYSYGQCSHVFFTMADNRNGEGCRLYANFLTQDWNSSVMYYMSTFKLDGADELISVFEFTGNNDWVCLTKSHTPEKYGVNMFSEEHGNAGSYIRETTPRDDLFNNTMDSVCNYEGFIMAWDTYISRMNK